MSFIALSVQQALRHVTQRAALTTPFRALSISPQLFKQNNSAVTAIDVPSVVKDQGEKCKSLCEKINQQVINSKQGRLFAVVHLCGKQFKVTSGDIILVEGYWPPTIGDELRLDKVLLAAARDFTLIGRPIIDPGLVTVSATVIEKTLSHTKTHFKKKRRKQFMRINFQRSPLTMIRINCIEIRQLLENVNRVPETEAQELQRIF